MFRLSTTFMPGANSPTGLRPTSAKVARMAASSYSARARLQPALLAAFPLSALSVAIFVAKPSWWSSLIAVGGASGVSTLAAQVARAAGRSREPELWERWGGPPTSSALRHRSATNPVQLHRYHAAIKRILGITLPTAEEEATDPVKADLEYETAVKGLIERTREPDKFPVVFEELCSYGFRRNLFGLREAALAACLFSAIGSALGVFLASSGSHDLLPEPFVVVLALDVAEALFMWRAVTPEWVRDPSETYAKALLGATEKM